MYKTTFIFSLFLWMGFKADAQTLKGMPKYPQRGEKLSLHYSGQQSNADGLDVTIYQFKKAGFSQSDIQLTENKGQYHFSYTPDTTITALAFVFKYKQDSASNVLMYPLFAGKKKVQYANGTEARMFSTYANSLLKISPDTTKAISFFEQELNIYPESSPLYVTEYATLKNSVGGLSSKKKLVTTLNKLMVFKNWSEDDYNSFISAFMTIKQKRTADSLLAVVQHEFPEGKWKMQQLYSLFFRETNIEIKQQYYDQYMVLNKQHNGDNTPNSLGMGIQMAYAYMEANDPSMFSKYLLEANKTAKIIAYQKYVEKLLISKTFPEYALQFSKTIYDHAEDDFKSAQPTNAIQLERYKIKYAEAADLMGRVLSSAKNYNEGIVFAKQAVILSDYTNHHFNDRYLLLAEKAMPSQLALQEAAKLLNKGSGTDTVIAIAKRLYLAAGHRQNDFNMWLNKNDSIAKNNLSETLKKEMIKKLAPEFYLSDITGKAVSLTSFKGKTLILDFWATWCVPCLASFPAMDQTRKKYAADSNVVFLFINTREKGDGKLKMVKSFLNSQQTQFDFNYLFDLEDKTLNAYGVKGIPAKFVIDRNGMIRFNTTGFKGQDLDLVNELSAMIELAKETD